MLELGCLETKLGSDFGHAAFASLPSSVKWEQQ